MTPRPIFPSVGAELGISSRKKPVSEVFSSLHTVYETIICIELRKGAEGMVQYYVENSTAHRSKDEKKQRERVNENIASYKDISHYAPSWLDTKAKNVYKEIIKNSKKGRLKALDKYNLAVFCSNYVKVQEASAHLEKEGLVKKDKPNPYFRIYNQLSEVLRKEANDLGISLSARARLELHETQTEEQQDDPMKEFFDD